MVTSGGSGGGDASSANQLLQLTQETSTATYLASILALTPALGQATAANSVPVVLASNQGALTVTGAFYPATQPVSGTVTVSNFPATYAVTGTFWQATQPVSAAALPLPAGASTEATLAALSAKFSALGQTTMSASVPVTLASNQSAVPVSGTFWQATQPVSLTSTTITGTVASTQSGTWTVQPGNTANTTAWKVDGSAVTQPVSIATAPVLVAGAAIIGKVGIDQTTPGTTNKVSIGTDGTVTINTLPAGTNAIGKLAANSGVDIGDVDVTSIAPPTLTKGTQDATGFSVQELKDAGRVHVNYYATAAAAGSTTTETAITLTKSSGTSATSTGTSFVVTSGKRYRIESITVATRGHSTATIQTTTFKLRVNTAGAVTTSSTPVVFSARSATPATASAWDRFQLPIPDGFEIAGDGTLQIGITAAATYTTNAPTWDVAIIGYEY
jgi:hypothetical protein